MSAGPETATRIVATVGPSISADASLRHVMLAGVSGFRVPLARQRSSAVDLSERIGRASHDLGMAAAVYLDVPGPKKHLVVPSDTHLLPGEETRIPVVPRDTAAAPADLHLLADTLTAHFTQGDILLLGDGETALSVVGVTPGELTVRGGGMIAAGHYGVAVAGKEGHRWAAPIDAATAELVASVPDASVMGSFIESGAQVRQMRSLLPSGRQVWAKVETRSGADHIEEITAEADGILLGRGDLLIDAGELEYYACELRVIAHVIRTGVPLMVGTQLWTSSSAMFLPHRSELAYVCGLFALGVDSVLLSDETTVGVDPSRTVAQMAKLIGRYRPR